jgi:hypothetical protein
MQITVSHFNTAILLLVISGKLRQQNHDRTFRDLDLVVMKICVTDKEKIIPYQILAENKGNIKLTIKK